MRLLAVDIGNTNIVFGLYMDNKLEGVWRLPTTSGLDKTKHKGLIRRQLRLNSVDGVIICSVVPEVLSTVKSALHSIFKVRPLVIGKDIKVPIKNLYRKPSQVGTDRLVNAYAALQKYAKPLVIIDFGTAVTFDLVNKKSGYAGGLIFPGLELSIEALFKKAALLPKIQLKKPRELLGKDTAESMRSGLVHGYASLVEGIVSRLLSKNKSAQVIATGGHAALIKSFCKTALTIERNLTLQGLALLYRNEISTL